jgi:hypothetical protein
MRRARWRPRWASCTNNCCAAAAAWRCAPSTAGLRSWRRHAPLGLRERLGLPADPSRWKTSPCCATSCSAACIAVCTPSRRCGRLPTMLVRRHRRSMLPDWLTAAWLRGPMNSRVPMRPATCSTPCRRRGRAVTVCAWTCAGLLSPPSAAAPGSRWPASCAALTGALAAQRHGAGAAAWRCRPAFRPGPGAAFDQGLGGAVHQGPNEPRKGLGDTRCCSPCRTRCRRSTACAPASVRTKTTCACCA